MLAIQGNGRGIVGGRRGVLAQWPLSKSLSIYLDESNCEDRDFGPSYRLDIVIKRRADRTKARWLDTERE